MFSIVGRVNCAIPKTQGASFTYRRIYAYSSSFCPEFCVRPPDTYFPILLGGAITGVIRPSRGKYPDCVFGGRRTCSKAEFSLGMGCVHCPIALDPWTFYSLPVLGQAGYLLGPMSDSALNTAGFIPPHVDPSQDTCIHLSSLSSTICGMPREIGAI